MKWVMAFTFCLGLFAMQIVANPVTADGAQDKQGLDDKPHHGTELAEAVFIGGTIECTVVEVSTQYESASFDSQFQCVADPGDAAGLEPGFYELSGLPVDFEQKFRGELKSGETKLEASNIYRLQRKLIFTTDTVWSLIQISGE
tara:strand:+ start:122044 stop:122475 length:432 start_codon:yes stop_codon:yes gene_type:complete